ncbi:xanthine dehydrogenase small subunit [Hahella sp. CCB-MM4]|uniref:xanthine dehydrogenase small subunit n=1 Tax=Hahella sp. (strain CCB-MM4) TaxID=1926491 RepID=UPI000B9C15B0|nr:xanthine dehydrogenase small subunit [Hahella sp. CCB-MM4]OZG70132.1 xanthine dehydrogenase small subunit [Hahella sp. CCB-MM4]
MTQTTIKFLLNNELHSVENFDPNTTVLNYLRNDLNRCGTKEGCASGDCGACTVVVGELENGKVRYKSINSCITFLPALHGKQLLTVEDLKQGDQLHPAQQAIVDCHGSQCGFCTPGFVMSLYALNKNHPSPSKDEAMEALSGNLCRCTGYRPIVDAALNMGSYPSCQTTEPSTTEQLQAINDGCTATLSNSVSHYFSPTSIDELAQLLIDYPKARLLAGGTDLALEVTQFHRDLSTIVYVGNVAELKTVTETESSLVIGSAVTYNQCVERLEQEYPELGEMIERLGSLQIRNQGTIGGNIGNASPIGDMPPVLIALDATMTLRRGHNTRTIKVADYFHDYKVTDLKPNEFIQSIEVPKAKPGHVLKIYKISKRIDDDISAILGALYFHIENQKVQTFTAAFGGMAAIPKRALHCEAALQGQPWNELNVESAMQALELDFKPLSDVRASAEYRMDVAKNLLMKSFLEINQSVGQQKTATRVTGYA